MLRGYLVAGILLAASAGFGAPITFTGFLTGPAEFPANGSPGTGSTTVIYDSATHMLSVDFTFSGLLGTTTASHIHCCVAPDAGTPTAGVATTTPTFAGFPLGVTSGSYSNILDLTLASSYNPAFVSAHGGTTAGAEAFLADGLIHGMAYLNIHTTSFGGGEIRSFLTEAVPEPASLVLVAGGLTGLWLVRRKLMPR
jgi:hypothetical protein